MKRQHLFILLLLSSMLIGCGSTVYKGFIVEEKSIPPGYEYLGDMFVIKEGYYFLWCIPFATNSKEAAIDVMVQKTKIGFPNVRVDGLFDIQVMKTESIGLFDWAPEIVLKGKAARKINP